MVGILAYIYEENVQTELEMGLNNTFLTSYMIDDDVTHAVDFLQEKVTKLFLWEIWINRRF
jgi:CD151 antigen